MYNMICKNFEGTEFKYDRIENILWRKLKGGIWRIVELTPNKRGYCRINVNNKHYFLHRIIMFLCNDEFNIFDLKQVIDHRNRVKINNNIDNLNIVTIKQNSQNTNAKGYYCDKSNNRWIAYIWIDGKQKNYSFKSEEEAKQKRAELVQINYYQG